MSEILSGSKSNVVKKRWHMSFTAVYSLRAFLSHPSSTFGIHHSVLTNLIKEKSRDQLAELGGVDGICTSLKTDQESGISGDEEDRYEAFGRNTYPNAPTKSFFHFVRKELKDPSILIQLVFALFSLVLGMGVEGVCLLFGALLVMFVAVTTNFKQSRQFDKLSNVSDADIQVEVVRDGRRQHVSTFEIVVGDVVCLRIGDQVPAHGLFIEGNSLQVDESSMTGESDHIQVDRDVHPFLLSRTKVVDGYAKMVVTCVGMNTFSGEMTSTTDDCDKQTPLQEQLQSLTSWICIVGLVVGLVVLVLLLVRYFTGNTEDEDGNREFKGSKTKVLDVMSALLGIVSTAFYIVVVAIPEGLPLSVTLALTYSIEKMMGDKVMVRKLSACETMGSTTSICVDKTGTLTLNQMKVTKFWLGKELMIEGSNYSSFVVELFHQGVGLNTTGSVHKSGDSFEFSGSPTEKAILSWGVLELKMDMEAVQRDCNIVRVEAFNSERKRSGILIKKVGDDNGFHVHWKGAAEMILAMCSHYYDLEGNMTALSVDERMEIDQLIQGTAASSLRCIAFAHKHVFSEANSIHENGLTLLGFVGLKDPCRPGVKKAVEDCRHAGVDVKMITGDNVFTAKAIATECGILEDCKDDESVVEGEVFRNYTDEERMAKVDKIRVMARSSPSDKLLMVQCLQKKGNVVAVTGDGANDALALREADIGLSMGIQGTEVAKENSDIIILDDNFASVATVLKWGRCVHNNIKKFIQFQLTVNVGALVINFVAAVSGVELPLTIMQMLWANLIMDTLGALALATEKPSKKLMGKRAASEPLISNVMWINLMAQAMYQIVVLLTLEFRGEVILGITKKVNDTLIFNVFILCQIFNEFNARKTEKKNVFEGIGKNKLFLVIIGISLVLQVVIVEFLNKFADTERLNFWQWGMCIGIAAASWPIALLVKFAPVPDTPFLIYLPSVDRVVLKIFSFIRCIM